MKPPLEHTAEIAKRDYPLGFDGTHVFAPDEITLLKRYGHWLEALAGERIQAFTADQKRFISVTKEEQKPDHSGSSGFLTWCVGSFSGAVGGNGPHRGRQNPF